MKRFIIALFVLTLAGLLFSSYLSAVKLFSGTCALGESCPYFLGYPACFYGFAMYLVMFIVTLLAFFRQTAPRTAFKTDGVVALLGIVFAGSFVIQEIAAAEITGTLGLTTCAYGLIFYVAIFITTLVALGKSVTPKNHV